MQAQFMQETGLDRMTKSEQREWLQSWFKELHQFRSDFTAAIIHDVVAESTWTDDEAAEKLPKVEYQFLIFVWLPCWLEHRRFPGELFASARRGNLDALERLLRIDKAIVADRRIAQHIFDASRDKTRSRFNRLSRALAGVPAGRFSRLRVKAALAAFLWLMSRRLNDPLTAPQLRELFDAYAAIKGRIRDRDLPISDEAWAKALQRDRKLWQESVGHKSV